MNEYVENRNGVYYIRDKRISLDSVIHAFLGGSSPESIRDDFEGLTLGHVYGAIAFYLDRPDEMQAYLAKRKEQWLELERRATPTGPELQARLDAARQASTLRS